MIKKVKTLSIMTLAALSFSAAVAHAATTATIVNGGTVHFKGEVVNAACAVDTNSSDSTVLMGQVRSAKLATQGATSTAVGFNIQLNDCDTSVSTHASAAFFGPTVNSTNTTVLALQNSAAGSATNVGIQILDQTGTPLVMNGTTFSAQSTLSNGTNILPFQARYFATGAATPGIANADATFKVQYQ
ncbi:type 1 fimbrial major subunit FimA [Serratia sp. JSRIV004]|uniref:type 1 fimbrial major subunit FimA n=1 Tax=Serratia sp. JSRIV004 TaxID=2831895 RepID=UPI001CBAD2C1|nr:type 1 fimbrial major subunit FimA [Serratia sp. JSRIV004]UAN58519.1 type 1 fimbrial major subunit FimA [Serratia sp. JSRIV004]